MRDEVQNKIKFTGIIRSVQPRSNVWRYRLDNRTHSLTGYNIFLHGEAEDQEGDIDFVVAISEKQQMKSHFHIGDKISGTAWTKRYPHLEYADYYRAGTLKKISAAGQKVISMPPPYTDECPAISLYHWRGCRMLDKRRWSGKCLPCKWAAMANVTIEYDWGNSQRFRFESFCYGPKSCPFYSMGKPRAVPDKKLGSLYDEGWLDDICTENREEDE